jgi:multiple antibiotic resistance protein
MIDTALYLHIFITIFSVLNPLSIIPIYLTITADETAAEKKVTIKRTTMTVIVILLLSAFIGNYLV